MAGAGFAAPGPLGLGHQLHVDVPGISTIPFPADARVTAYFIAASPQYQLFKARVLAQQIRNAERRDRKFVATLADARLEVIGAGSKEKLLKEAAPQCRALLQQARKDLGDAGLADTTLGISSGYRSVEKEQTLWHSYFEKYYLKTGKERAALGEDSDAAVNFMARYVGEKKAAPGFSNHSMGIAVDFFTKVGKIRYGASWAQRAVWKGTWFYKWLAGPETKDGKGGKSGDSGNAAKFGFKPYWKEPWHWEYKP